jgi:DNA-binding transcriptional LysR family regulator
MNWNDVRYLLAVARHGGLTGASRELKVSQSTVARRIETLESALHTRLFERRANGYELTDAGRGMVEKAVAIETRMVEMESDFSGHDAGISGTVRVVTVETLAHQLIIPRLPALQDAYPDLSLGVAINASFARLPQREADIGLRLCRPEQGAYTIKRLGTIAFGLYASPDYLARHPVVEEPLPIAGHRLITWGDPLSYIALPKAMRSWTRDGTAVLVLDSVQAQVLAIKSGLGLGILPCIVADGDDGLVRVNPNQCSQDENIWLVVPNDIRHARRVRVVCDFLATAVRERQPALAGKRILAVS